MRPAAGSQAAREAVQQVAKKAAAVFQALTHAPAAPSPAGVGVDVAALRQALPCYGWRELTTVANYFGQRGTVVGPVAAEVAAEIGRRLSPAVLATSAAPSGPPAQAQTGRSTASRSAAAAAAEALPAARPREVAAIVYAFSKLRPQLPEYGPIYDSVALGIRHATWALNRMQAAVIGAALADAGRHLSDALPAVVRPVLRELIEAPQAQGELAIDELRYLLHACAHIQRPAALTAEEVQVLAGCTRRAARSANFSRSAHMAVSWLLIEPPPAAKEAHLDALRAACVQLYSESPHEPAHPLPPDGLAPALTALLAREARQDPPPLTPPRLREIVTALVRVGEGLSWTSASRTRSLGFADWMEMAPAVISFCEAHDVVSADDAQAAAQGRGEQRTLPSWAASMLGHIVVKAREEGAEAVGPVDLQALLTLLRLLRRYRPRPSPDEKFFLWAARQAAMHCEAGTASPGVLAEVVGELVPRLPDAHRGRLARLLLSPRPEAPAAQAAPSPQLLATAGLRLGGSGAARLGITLVPGPAALPQPSPGLVAAAAPMAAAAAAVAPPPPLAQQQVPSMARAASVTAGRGHLWGLLSSGRPASAPPAEQRPPTPASASSASAPASAPAAAARAVEEERLQELGAAAGLAQVAHMAVAAEAEPSAGKAVDELRAQLERALQRVEALEARLDRQAAKQQQQQAAEPRSPSEARRAEAEPMEATGLPLPTFPGLGLPGALLGGGGLAGQAMPTSSQALVNLYRPFVFEEHRRAESPRLQRQRQRVVMPLGEPMVPMWWTRK